MLIEGINYINLYYPEYDAEKFIDPVSGDRYSVEMVKKVTKNIFDFSCFLHMLVFDYLIGNSDRHQSNWAVLYGNGQPAFSPLYDNGSSLCAFISDEQAVSYLGNDEVRWRSLVDTKSRSLIRRTMDDSKRPTHLEMMQHLHDNYFDETKNFVKRMQQVLSDDIIASVVDEASEGLLSDYKKELIFRFLHDKILLLKNLYSEKE